MSSLNSLSLIGRLGRDPEQRSLPSGDAVTNVSLAVSERWKDKSGEQREKTTWFDLSFWGPLSNVAAQYLRKGHLVYVEGPVSGRHFTDKQGEIRVALDVRVGVMKMLTAKNEGSQPSAAAAPAAQPSPVSTAAAVRPDFDDDIPF